ncbi:hypothetical protein [Methylobacterium trifolii]|uniref:Uncharacterized protein n=1 Tax=Methylobacterium trifolii TaxID=1003092 RepID=A0ABQ4U1V6_9HYPH|nr:hypothetical protein [Methylobacterium trifolii]GJE60837.1 hypothetical protein MPOCJGCO_2955 [Methylobacterium trifolii]
MLLTALLVLTTLLPRLDGGLDAISRRARAEAPAPTFQAEARAVSNWHGEAGAALRPVSLALVARFAQSDPAFVARCVKLNNYWCIKRARWPGEIGGDAEGHTAFATAADGADAAASLLRRYYREYGRRTGLAIVRRWAPAECRAPGTEPLAAVPARSSFAIRSAPARGLAPRGIGGTLRARYLARHRPGGALRHRVVRGPALRVQPWSPLARMAGRPGARPRGRALPMLKPVPDIATRIEASARTPPRGADDPMALLERRTPSPERLLAESAALPPIAAGSPSLDLRLPPLLCTSDEGRIGNYAALIARSVGLNAGDDLKLFAADGSPLPNLAPVLLAMSGVELGTMRAAPDLVRAAVGRLAAPPATPTAEAAP